MHKRLFIALDLPKNIRDEILNLIKVLKESMGEEQGNVKWVEENNLHINLHFLGYVNKTDIPKFKLLLNGCNKKRGPAIMRLGEVGLFPHERKPQNVYLECNQIDSSSIMVFRKFLGEELQKLGTDLDYRPWKTHITLGRVKKKFELKIKNYEFKDKNFIIDKFGLFESKRLPQIIIYKTLAEYKL